MTTGQMVALQNGEVVRVELETAVAELKTVNPRLREVGEDVLRLSRCRVGIAPLSAVRRLRCGVVTLGGGIDVLSGAGSVPGVGVGSTKSGPNSL